MQFSTIILGLVASAITVTQACLVLNGAYYTKNQHLMLTLTDNDVQLCTFDGPFTTSSVFLNCADGHYAWIRQPNSAERNPELKGWNAGYAFGGRDYHFGVDATPIISWWGNIQVGKKLYAANYGC